MATTSRAVARAERQLHVVVTIVQFDELLESGLWASFEVIDEREPCRGAGTMEG